MLERALIRKLEPEILCSRDLVPSCASIVKRARDLGYEILIPGVLNKGPWIGGGFSSKVFLVARSDGSKAALKIRRSSSKTNTLAHEAYILKILRGCYVQPRLIDHGDDYILMEYIQGLSLGKILKIYGEGGIGREHLRIAVASIIRSLYELDTRGIDHKEVADPRKHVIFPHGSPYRARIIDLESASIRERANNVPRFIGGFLLRRLRSMLGEPSEGVKNLARIYKIEPGQRERIVKELEEILLQP